jgi:hypothetical protein
MAAASRRRNTIRIMQPLGVAFCLSAREPRCAEQDIRFTAGSGRKLPVRFGVCHAAERMPFVGNLDLVAASAKPSMLRLAPGLNSYTAAARRSVLSQFVTLLGATSMTRLPQQAAQLVLCAADPRRAAAVAYRDRRHDHAADCRRRR